MQCQTYFRASDYVATGLQDQVDKRFIHDSSKPLVVYLQDDATEAEWYDVTKLPALAFDHKLIIRTAFEHLLRHSETQTTGELVL